MSQETAKIETKKLNDADLVVNKKVDTKYLADIEDVDDRKRAFD